MSIMGSLLGSGGASIAKGLAGAGGLAASSSGSSWWKSLLGSSNLWGAVLGGIGTAAGSKLDAKAASALTKLQGDEQRKTIGYTAALDDYYNQKNKIRQRKALDTYGQFSMLSRYAPNYQAPAPLDQPQMPGL